MAAEAERARRAPPRGRVPALGPKLPRRGNVLSRGFGRFVLWLLGWRVDGKLPDTGKFIIVGAPHTSNMDAVVGLAALMALGLRANTMIKDSAFIGPLGWLLHYLGAIPIDRASPKGVVEQSVDAFAQREQMVLLITPEGTRKSAPEFKRGFHRIARGAGVPVVPAAANYREKAAILGEPMSAGEDYEQDLQVLLRFFHEHGVPRRPERLSLPLRDFAQRR